MGLHGGDITEMENSYYGILRISRNITDIMEIAIMEYYGILRSVISPPPPWGSIIGIGWPSLCDAYSILGENKEKNNNVGGQG